MPSSKNAISRKDKMTVAKTTTNDNKKNLLRELLLIGVSITLLIAIALGWFQVNHVVRGDGIFLYAGSEDVIATLYHQTAPDTWEEVSRIDIKEYLPSQSETYKLELENKSSTTAYQTKIELNDFGQTQNVGDVKETTAKLEDKIFLTQVNADGALTQHNKVLSALFTPETRNIILVPTITIPKSSAVTIIFTFRLDENAENIYQHKSLSFQKIQIVNEAEK